MSIDIDYNNRQLIPRLLPSRISSILSLNINSTSKSPFSMNPFELHNYNSLMNEWRNEKNIIIAIQILSYEVIHDSLPINKEILKFITKRKNILNPIELEILNIATAKTTDKISEICKYEDSRNSYSIIKDLKQLNNINLLNPFQWCNLGYYYTTLGLKEKAKRSFLVAINLNNSNKYVVRSVARFFLHIDESDFAHKILTSSPRLKKDPGILSAEIAIAELLGRPSKLLKHGVLIGNDNNFSVKEKNELIAQLATVEFSYGKKSKGKKLVELCLTDPNENSLAQFEFLSKNDTIDQGFDAKNFTVMCQYEALARSYFENSEFENSLQNSKLWTKFQPFSNKPAILSSYIAAAVLLDYKQAIDIATKALNISPGSTALKNNLAFSYAKDDNIVQANSVLSTININKLDLYEKAVLSATIGFVEYKKGNIELSKKGYNIAIKYFRHTKNEIALARALYNYSFTIKDIEREESEKYLKEVEKLSKKHNIVELLYFLKTDK